MQREKYSVYLARASHAEEQAAKAKDDAGRSLWSQAAKIYREAALEAKRAEEVPPTPGR